MGIISEKVNRNTDTSSDGCSECDFDKNKTA
jgi:hypothetical protein